MMRTLVLMRHGQAEAQAASDASRRLTGHGILEVRSSARQLQRMAVQPAVVITSSYLRALQTGELVLGECAPRARLESDSMFTPEADAQSAVDYLLARSEPTLLIACHMPIVAYMMMLLTNGRQQWAFPTAGAAVLQGEGLAWRVVQKIQPELDLEK